jgi:hypothetical protein
VEDVTVSYSAAAPAGCLCLSLSLVQHYATTNNLKYGAPDGCIICL